MQQRSIQFRLTAWYALALAAALFLFAIAVGVSTWSSLIHDIDNSLVDRIHSIESFLRTELTEPGVQVSEELSEYAHAFPANSPLCVRDDRGSIIFTSDRAFPWPPLAPLHSSQRWHGHDYRLLEMTFVPNGRVWTAFVAEPLDTAEHLQSRLWLLLAALSPVVIAIATLAGAWMSRRALKPVDEITAAARTISIENLSRRLLVPQSGDELQRLAETWNSMLTRLEDAVKRLRTFTADASHELRTPLTIIRTTAEIACRKSRSAESYRESLLRIVAESERMTQLVEDLLFLARCDAQTLDIPLTKLDLSAIVADVGKLLAPLADEKGVAMRIQHPSTPLPVAANAPAIHRLILILVDNAIKYTSESGQVTIKLSKVEQTIQLAVEDSGPGIGETELPRIFDRFYRGPRASRNGQGSGLGLALAAGIAQHHGAMIDVVSEVGKGSTFMVAFPLAIEGSETLTSIRFPTFETDAREALGSRGVPEK